jgi:hypothetical protein
MKMFGLLAFAAALFCSIQMQAQTRPPVVRFKDVRTVFVDETSFKIVSSSCGTTVGGMLLPCAKHSDERLEFLVVLKRWLGKSGFTVVDNRDDADGILQGDISMNDWANAPAINDPDYKKKRDMSPLDKAAWYLNTWIANQNGYRLWTIRRDYYPDISYSAAGKAKIEGKKLAMAIRYDFKKAK